MKAWLLRGVVAAVVAAGAVAVIVFVRTASVSGAPARVTSAGEMSLQRASALQRLDRALGTGGELAGSGPGSDASDLGAGGGFERSARRLEAAFPGVHRELELHHLPGPTRVYIWRGSDPDRPPVLLSAELGEPDSAPGRRELALAMMEAAESLIDGGAQPRRTVILVLAGQEPEAPVPGEARATELLLEMGVRPGWALVPGPGIAAGVVPGVRAPVGLVGVTERGRFELDVSVEADEGDLALPGTADATLARAVDAAAAAAPSPRLRGPARDLVEGLAPHADPATRMLASNLWLFGGTMTAALAAEPVGRAQLGTTVTPAAFDDDTTASVEPADDRARTERRVRLAVEVAPWDTPEEAEARVRRAVGRVTDVDGESPGVDGEPAGVDGAGRGKVRIRVSRGPDPGIPPAPTAPTRGEGYAALKGAILRAFPGTATALPFVALGPTSARHYQGTVGTVYRFTPLRMEDRQLERGGGPVERPSDDAYLEMVRFYAAVLEGVGVG